MGGGSPEQQERLWAREHLRVDNSYMLSTAKILVMQLLVNFLPFVVACARQSGAQSGVWGALSHAYGFGLLPPGTTMHSQPMTDACVTFFFCTVFINAAALWNFHSSHITVEAKIGSNPSEFYPGQDWGEAQLANTVNWKPCWYLPESGLEYQIEHHLFPTLSIANIAVVQPVVKQTAKEFGLVYHEYSNFGECLREHIEFHGVLSREKKD